MLKSANLKYLCRERLKNTSIPRLIGGDLDQVLISSSVVEEVEETSSDVYMSSRTSHSESGTACGVNNSRVLIIRTGEDRTGTQEVGQKARRLSSS